MKEERAAFSRQMQKKLEFMQSKGYLGEGDSQDHKNLAVMLSNYLDFQTVCSWAEDDDYNLKLIRMTWNKLLTRDLVSYQVMQAPTGLVFYMREKLVNPPHRDVPGDIQCCIESEAVVAKTRKYGCDLLFPGKRKEEYTVLEPETLIPDQKCGYLGDGLSAEACLEINARNMAADLDNEIIEDLYNNCRVMPGDWKDGLMCNLSHKLYPSDLRGIVTNEIGLRLIDEQLNGRLNKLPIIQYDNLPSRLVCVGKVGPVPLYYHPKVNKILLIRRGESYMQSGYFFCPYSFFSMTPTMIVEEKVRRGALIRYGKILVREGNQYYQAFEF